MKKDDYERVGYAIFIIGILCVVGAGVAEIYEAPALPYASYDLPLLISGIASLEVGAVFLWQSKREEQKGGLPQPSYVPPPR